MGSLLRFAQNEVRILFHISTLCCLPEYLRLRERKTKSRKYLQFFFSTDVLGMLLGIFAAAGISAYNDCTFYIYIYIYIYILNFALNKIAGFYFLFL